MANIRQGAVTITLSTVGAGSGYCSTVLNGLVHSIYLSISKAVGANSKITVTGESTKNLLLVVPNPSTLGAYYYPRNSIVGTTGNTIGSTEMRTRGFLCNERFKVSVASSSGLEDETATISVNVY
jgi:hypothetical protein